MYRQPKRVNGSHPSPGVDTLSPYSQTIMDYFREIPGIRWEKVFILQRLISSGHWFPQNAKVAEMILRDHLLDPL